MCFSTFLDNNRALLHRGIRYNKLWLYRQHLFVGSIHCWCWDLLTISEFKIVCNVTSWQKSWTHWCVYDMNSKKSELITKLNNPALKLVSTMLILSCTKGWQRLFFLCVKGSIETGSEWQTNTILPVYFLLIHPSSRLPLLSNSVLSNPAKLLISSSHPSFFSFIIPLTLAQRG